MFVLNQKGEIMQIKLHQNVLRNFLVAMREAEASTMTINIVNGELKFQFSQEDNIGCITPKKS